MSYQPNFLNSLNATSSQESASGPSPYDKQAGPIIDESGQAVARANLSARQVKALGSMMSGTFGRPGIISLESNNLQSSLASRLQALTACLGSTLYNLTWKERATPSGRSITALRATARPTSANASTLLQKGWATPAARDY